MNNNARFLRLLLATTIAIATAACSSQECDPDTPEPDTDCEKVCVPGEDEPGSPCEIEGQECSYADAGCVYLGVCEDGVWKGETSCSDDNP